MSGRLWAYMNSTPFLKYGVPFICLTVGSSFVVSEFTQTRFRYNRYKLVQDEIEKTGRVLPNTQSLEEVYEEYQKESETESKDDYQMIRGPRPWEEGNVEIQKPVFKVNPTA